MLALALKRLKSTEGSDCGQKLSGVELVPGQGCGLELSLKENDAVVDLHQRFSGARQRKRLLHYLERLSHSSPPQKKLRTLLRALAKPQSELQTLITSIWIELDHIDLHQGQIAPNVFVGFTPEAPESTVFSVLSRLQPDLPDAARRQIARLGHLSRQFGGRPAHCGVMMSRASSAVRVNFQGIQRIDTVEFLDKAGWCANLEHAADFLAFACGLSRRRNLALDVDEQILMRLGVEIFPDTGSPTEFWPTLLESLVERGLGEAQKVADVLAFQGTLSPVSAPEYWPDSLMIDHLFARPGHLPWMVFRISHVKLSWVAGTESAKIYLVAEPRWQQIGSALRNDKPVQRLDPVEFAAE